MGDAAVRRDHRARRDAAWRHAAVRRDHHRCGNSFYKDDIRRAKPLNTKGIRHVDCGTSGGVWGLERGYCLMSGGEKEAIDHLDSIFKALAPGRGDIPRTPKREHRDPRVELGYVHCGPSGVGRFVKMVHNGIEYGLMLAYAEGFDILRNAASEALPEEQRYAIDLPDIAEVWRRGSVISSWLLDLSAMAFAEDQNWRATRVLWRTLAKVAGRSWRRSRKRCRPMCCPRPLRPLPLAREGQSRR
jgi:6-phosphogluconate dehydrogenase (decarboxylating)